MGIFYSLFQSSQWLKLEVAEQRVGDRLVKVKLNLNLNVKPLCFSLSLPLFSFCVPSYTKVYLFDFIQTCENLRCMRQQIFNFLIFLFFPLDFPFCAFSNSNDDLISSYLFVTKSVKRVNYRL